MTEWAGTQQKTLPADVIDKFRIAAVERLQRLETAWGKLAADPNDAETIAAIDREVHTLKGESRMVGFTDVDLVAHKLEDVLELARERKFQISDDIDLVVTMALRFMGMLIRKKAGQTLGGIDLPGFVRQIDSVISDTRRQHPLRGRIATTPIGKLDANRELMSNTVRDRLAGVALDLFLELSSGRDSRRIRRGWNLLRDSLAPSDPNPIAPVLAKHQTHAEELARDLGKEVELVFDLDNDARAPSTVVDALDIATLHLVRNAIDHGVELPDDRVAAGKSRTARVSVRCTIESERIVLEVSDDGPGVDFPRVRSRAVALGLLQPQDSPSDAELSKMLFHPGLTTRKIATEVSGRGIGLDAAQSTVSAVGGNVSVRSQPGDGSVWSIVIPSPVRRFRVRKFTVRGTAVPFAVPTEWEIQIVSNGDGTVDLVEELGLGPPAQNPFALDLTRGESMVRIGAASEPIEADARWLVTTSSDTLAGIVSIDNTECLVLRPDLLVNTTGRVAIVDDSEIVRELVGFSLKPYGIEVVQFADPNPLVGSLVANPVDIVLLDLSFKGMDVAAFVQRIKDSIPTCVVYLHSDRTPIELARIAETSGADGHIAKAVGRDQFVNRILRILRTRRTQAT